MSKENVILIDYDAPDDWEFHKAIEKTTGTKWTVSLERQGLLRLLPEADEISCTQEAWPLV